MPVSTSGVAALSLEAVSAVDADLSRVSAASQQLASALSQENAGGGDAKPDAIEQGHAAVQAAEADLEQAQAALQSAQAAASVPAAPTAPTPGHSVTGPGGIVV